MKTIFILLCSTLLLCACGGEEKITKLKIGDVAPMFTGVDLDGAAFNLRDFAGEPVVIRFWETDCKYCKADTSVFNDLNVKFKDKGLHIAYINTLSNLEEVKHFIEILQVKFPVLMDEGGVIAKMYHVRVVPQTIVINAEHKIIAAISGGVSEEVILDLLSEELQ